jgi:hypothetical protein
MIVITCGTGAAGVKIPRQQRTTPVFNPTGA